MDLPEPLRQFAADPDAVPIEDALFWVAACRPQPVATIETLHTRIDGLAEDVSQMNLAAMCHPVFGSGGFRGDTADYYDPQNSLLDLVVERRLGIPITLSVVLIAVARRLDVPIQAIGAPGHFLVLDPVSMDYRDPFNRGVIVERSAVGREVVGGGRSDEMVPAAGPSDIVNRVLNNLQNSFSSRDPRQLDWVLDLRLALPDELRGDQRVLASLCERRGRFGEAAALLGRLADQWGDDRLRRRVSGLAARLN